MTRAGRWALLLLCLLPSAGGRPYLAPPQNVTLLSWDFNMYLMWRPGPDNPQNVTYLVAYASSTNPRRWRKVGNCAGTKELACSLLCLEKQDVLNKIKGRVRALSAGARSRWVESKYLEYLFEVEPAPPVLVVTQTEEFLKVNATYQLPPCMSSLMGLNYEVDFWKESTGNKTRYPITPHGQPVQIPLHLGTRGHHCVSARTIYTLADSKYSQFSKPTCFSLETPGGNWALLVLLPFLPLLLVVVAIGCVIWKRVARSPRFWWAKKPQALDFSGHRHPVVTFQPSGPEYLEDLTLGPQKEPTRRVRLTARVRAPATNRAGLEDGAEEDEEDEEDADDDVSFQPYMAPAGFLEQAHQTPALSKAGVQAGDYPAWDSSDRSWASTAGSSSFGEAGYSGYWVKDGHGQGLGEDRWQEPFTLPEISKVLGSLEELRRKDLSSWANWDCSSPRPNLVPGEPLVSFQTLTFGWDSSLEEEEEEEEEEEGGRESEIEDSGAGSWGTEARSRTLGHYIAR